MACTKELNEWRMEVTCIYCTSLHTLPLVITLAWLLFNCVLLWLSSMIFMLGLNHLVLIRIVSPGYGFVHATDVCAVGYDGYYNKGIF
jgi:hypothetical protein